MLSAWNKHNDAKWAKIWHLAGVVINIWPLFFQVKPLLQVTRQDEEIQVREAELQKAKDKLTRAEQDYTELDKKHAQVIQPLSFFSLLLFNGLSSTLLPFFLCRSCWRKRRCWQTSCRQRQSCSQRQRSCGPGWPVESRSWRRFWASWRVVWRRRRSGAFSWPMRRRGCSKICRSSGGNFNCL